MKKPTTLIILCLCFTIAGKTQDFGYKTTDIGGEFQWYPDGRIYNLQFAFNSKTHNSFLLRGSYHKVPLKRTNTHDSEEGTGWGGSLGYRYYFSVLPKRFFVGLRTDLWSMNIHFAAGLTEGGSKITLFQPGVETGYTFLINEQLFITPYFLAGTQIKLDTKGPEVDYGKEGFVPAAGISAGWRF